MSMKPRTRLRDSVPFKHEDQPWRDNYAIVYSTPMPNDFLTFREDHTFDSFTRFFEKEEVSSSSSSWEVIPWVRGELAPLMNISPDIHKYILSFLDTTTLACSLTLVSHYWSSVACCDEIWREKCAMRGWGPQKTSSLSYKDCFVSSLRERHLKRLERAYWGLIPSIPVACGIGSFRDLDGLHLPVPEETNLFYAWKCHPSRTPHLTIEFADGKLSHQKFRSSAHNLYQFETILTPYGEEIKKDESLTRAVMDRYVRFMKLKVKYPDLLLIPTHDIEMVWMSHLLRPSMYQSDCLRAFLSSKLIDHSLLCNSMQWALKERALRDTVKIWESEYPGKPYLFSTLPTLEELEERHKRPHRFRKLLFGGCQCIEKKDLWYFDNNGEKDINKWKQFIVKDYVTCEELNSTALGLTCKEVMKDRCWFQEYQNFFDRIDHTTRRKLHYYGRDDELSDSALNIYMKMYEKLLFMKAKYGLNQGMYHPTYAIDLIWHTHMMYPVTYIHDCLKYTGAIMDHIPWPEDTNIQSNYCNTKELWKKEFNEDMETLNQVGAWMRL